MLVYSLGVLSQATPKEYQPGSIPSVGSELDLTRFLFSLALIILLAGALVHRVPPPRAKSLNSAGGQSAQSALLVSLKHVAAQYYTGNFREAGKSAQSGYQEALRARNPQIAARFLGNLGGCQFALHQYREALATFLQARRLAESSGDENTAAGLDFNISTLYSQLNQMDAAAQALDRAFFRLAGQTRAKQLPKLFIRMAALQADQDHMPEAVALYRRGITAADRAGDVETYTAAWNDLGYEFLEHGELRKAENALLEAYRFRKLNHLRSVEYCYRNLGMLRLEQGDVRSAAVLLDLAVEQSRRPGGHLPTWEVYYSRARVRLQQNRLRESLEDLRSAASLARNFRRQVPSSDASRVSVENLIQKVHSTLIEVGNRVYFETHDPALPRQTFESAEANRSASLRTLLSESPDWRRELPPDYWETLQKLESAETTRLQSPAVDSLAATHIEELQTALLQWESQASSNTDVELPGLLARTQRVIGTDAAFLAFHMASPDSYLWAVSRERFALYRLPQDSQIASRVAEFTRNIRTGASGNMAAAGNQIFRLLFGQLDPVYQEKRRWLLALDAQLFDLPFAALVTENGPRPVFLAERHSLQVVSGAAMLGPSAGEATSGPFVAVADPIYNEADPRWKGSQPKSASWFGWFRAIAGESEPAYPHFTRLVGSAREATTCAAAWGGPQNPVLLEGPSASRLSLQAALGKHPAVLHLATHVWHAGGDSGSGLIVLSLGRGARHEVVSPTEISTWNLKGVLVALSGCSSGSADALPATGLMGLTRACQAAGARSVVASHWATVDDAGSIFLSFYRHLRGTPPLEPAAALQQAQIDMLRSKSWRANPRYWSAYFATGNQL
ncbi:MAG: CHAT domain-containing tetratricopeptide repeat protein [Bryobacteraceae bacterium]|jgi:CHAT domain-containing protein